MIVTLNFYRLRSPVCILTINPKEYTIQPYMIKKQDCSTKIIPHFVFCRKNDVVLVVFLFIFSSICWAGGVKDEPIINQYFTGEGGKGARLVINAPKATGLADNQKHIPALVQGELHSNFTTYSAIEAWTPEGLQDLTVEVEQSGRYREIQPDTDPELWESRLGQLRPPDFQMDGDIIKTNTGYNIRITVAKTTDKMTMASFSETCTFEELDNLSGVRRASLDLLQKMNINLTEQARTELSRAATSKELNAQINLAKGMTAGETTFEKRYYTYTANQLDPTLAEAARRVAGYQTEIYKAAEISLAMPNIKIPEIKAPEFKAPEIKMAATGNIGADARRQLEQYNAQKEASRVRQESGNKAMKDLQDAFLEQFKIQSEAVKKQQSDLLKQRDTLLGQQKMLLERQRQMIAQLNDTENSYDTFFKEHPPFEIIFDPEPKPFGNANLEKGTIDMQFTITTVGTLAMQVIPLMLNDFEKGLGSIAQGLTDINEEFNKLEFLFTQVEAAGTKALAQLVNDYAAQMAKLQAAENNYAAQLAKLDTELKTTGYAQLGRDYAVRPNTGYAEGLAKQYAVQPVKYSSDKDKTMGLTWALSKWNKDEQRSFAIEARLENDKGKTIGRSAVTLINQISAATYTQPKSDSKPCVFQNIPVNDITDMLKVTIQRVNGKDVTVAANADYIKISSIEADGYTKDGWDLSGFDKNGNDMYGFNKDGYNKDGYNKEGFDVKGYNKKGYNSWGQTRQDEKRNEAEARRAASSKVMSNFGLNFSGWAGAGGNNITGGGNLEFRIYRWFGIQTGIYTTKDDGKNMNKMPFLARINFMHSDEDRAKGIFTPWFLSTYGGFEINFSDNNSVSPLFGAELGLVWSHLSLYGGWRWQKGASNDKSVSIWYGGLGIYTPLGKR